MIFADSSGGDGPVWVAASVSIIGIGYALFRFIFWLLGKKRGYIQEGKANRNEQAKIERRDAATEAWEVVDRLTKEVEGHAIAIAALQDREQKANERTAKCEAEHGETRGRLMVIEAWARQKGLRIPPRSVDSGRYDPLPAPKDDHDS